MRFYYVVLLAVAYLVFNADAAPGALKASPDFPTAAVTTEMAASPKRLLADTTGDSDDDERAMAATLEKLKNVFENAKLKATLTHGATIDDVLKRGIGELTAGKLKALQSRVATLNSQHPEKKTSLLAAFLNRYDDVYLALELQALRTGAADDVATSLQTSLFRHWAKEGSPLDMAAATVKDNPLLRKDIDKLRKEFSSFTNNNWASLYNK